MKHFMDNLLNPHSHFGLKIAAAFAFAATFLVLGSILVALPFWALWNVLFPRLFGFPHITLLDALGIIVMVKLLFGGYFKIGPSD